MTKRYEKNLFDVALVFSSYCKHYAAYKPYEILYTDEGKAQYTRMFGVLLLLTRLATDFDFFKNEIRKEDSEATEASIKERYEDFCTLLSFKCNVKIKSNHFSEEKVVILDDSLGFKNTFRKVMVLLLNFNHKNNSEKAKEFLNLGINKSQIKNLAGDWHSYSNEYDPDYVSIVFDWLIGSTRKNFFLPKEWVKHKSDNRILNLDFTDEAIDFSEFFIQDELLSELSQKATHFKLELSDILKGVGIIRDKELKLLYHFNIGNDLAKGQSVNQTITQALIPFIDKTSNKQGSSSDFHGVASKASNLQASADFVIFYGPPGTGKTKAARDQVNMNKDGYKIVQIHPSSSYEDLIEGIKPVTFPNGDVKYEVQDGPVKIMVKKAINSWVKSVASIRHFKDGTSNFMLVNFPIGTMAKWFLPGEKFSCRIPSGASVVTNCAVRSDTIKIDIKDAELEHWRALGFTLGDNSKIEELFIQLEFKGDNWGQGNYVLVLDELNRGNVASILGELVFAISEARGTHADKKAVSLQYSHEQFLWPSNLSLYGTMNSTDVSLDRIDQAIKRRFEFKIIEPDYRLLKTDGLEKGLNTYLNELNTILLEKGAEYGAYNVKDKLIGHSYFLSLCKSIHEMPKDENLKVFMGTELKKLWDSQILQSLLSIFNGSRDELDKFVSEKLKHLAPNKESRTIYGWPFNDSVKQVTEKRAS